MLLMVGTMDKRYIYDSDNNVLVLCSLLYNDRSGKEGWNVNLAYVYPNCNTYSLVHVCVWCVDSSGYPVYAYI